MELYRKYLEEREGAHLIDYDWGFAVYKYGQDHVYLQDIYVVPEKRKEGLGVLLMKKVEGRARLDGYSKMVGSVVPSTPFSDSMNKVMLSVGFKLHSSDKDIIYYVKEI